MKIPEKGEVTIAIKYIDVLPRKNYF